MVFGEKIGAFKNWAKNTGSQLKVGALKYGPHIMDFAGSEMMKSTNPWVQLGGVGLMGSSAIIKGKNILNEKVAEIPNEEAREKIIAESAPKVVGATDSGKIIYNESVPQPKVHTETPLGKILGPTSEVLRNIQRNIIERESEARNIRKGKVQKKKKRRFLGPGV